MKKESYLRMVRLSHIAVLTAMAVLLMFFEFSLPMIAPAFYKIDLSELPVFIGGFLLGPLAAVAIEALKILLYVFLRGTQTAFVGEISNFLLGCAFALPIVYGYRRYNTKKAMVLSLFTGIFSLVVAGFLLNLYVLIPAYVSIAQFPLEAILAAGKAIFPAIDSLFLFVLLCTTPFNFLKGSLLAVFIFWMQTRLRHLLHHHKQ